MALPTYFLTHGGGPWPYMAELREPMQALAESLRDVPRQIGVTPKALVVVSGHWEAPAFTVTASPRPPMLYDYGGFPPHTYRVRYPAPGDPALARRIAASIEAAGLPAALDAERGFDHGTFCPLAVMYPRADVPVVQLSLRQRLDPAEHLALGRALAPLRDEGVLIVGSGGSFHNRRYFNAAGRAPSAAFDVWLQKTLVDAAPGDRMARLLDWTQAPAARLAHAREEHLMPLMVAVGAAESEPGACVYHEDASMGLVAASSFRFEATANVDAASMA